MADRDTRAKMRAASAARAPTMEANSEMAAALQAQARQGVPWPLDGMIGKPVYLDGVRMSWWGVLVGVTSVYGEAALLLHPCFRVGDFQRSGPQKQYTMQWPSSDEEPAPIFLRDVSAPTLAPLNWPDPARFDCGA